MPLNVSAHFRAGRGLALTMSGVGACGVVLMPQFNGKQEGKFTVGLT